MVILPKPSLRVATPALKLIPQKVFLTNATELQPPLCLVGVLIPSQPVWVTPR